MLWPHRMHRVYSCLPELTSKRSVLSGARGFFLLVSESDGGTGGGRCDESGWIDALEMKAALIRPTQQGARGARGMGRRCVDGMAVVSLTVGEGCRV